MPKNQICNFCGILFDHRWTRSFCSEKCNRQSRIVPKETVKCKNCGIEFLQVRGKNPTGLKIFCDRQCSLKYYTKTRKVHPNKKPRKKCLRCGEECYNPSASTHRKCTKKFPICITCGKETNYYKGKYCSRICYYENRFHKKYKPQRDTTTNKINNSHQAWHRAKKKGLLSEDSNKKILDQIYVSCPEGYHVDHIISLSSGGLHHQDNLQYLTEHENFTKNKDSWCVYGRDRFLNLLDDFDSSNS